MVIDHSDEVGFPVPGEVGEYYDLTRDTSHNRRRCPHGRKRKCGLCAMLKARADAGYRRAIALSHYLERGQDES